MRFPEATWLYYWLISSSVILVSPASLQRRDAANPESSNGSDSKSRWPFRSWLDRRRRSSEAEVTAYSFRDPNVSLFGTSIYSVGCRIICIELR